MRIGKSFPKISTPDFKAPSSKPTFSPRPDINGNLPGKKPDLKPDTKPTFSPRPDINGNLPGSKIDKPTFSPRPDINGNLPGKKPDFKLDGFDKPTGGLDKLKPNGFGGLDNAFGSLGNKLSGFGNGLSAVSDVANGAAGLVGAGLQAASIPASALSMLGAGPVMDPSALAAGPASALGMMGAGPVMDPSALAAGPAMDPYAMGAGPAMDPYAAGGLPQQLGALSQPVPQQLGALPQSAPQQSDLGNLLNSVANAVSVATQALDTVKALVSEGSATGTLKKMATEVAPQLAQTLAPRIGLAGSDSQQ
ncbi:PspC family transcriptional regulator [Archangium gephyra]|nr:PspC family transcriptional regulator [Archangium gephyra]